MLIGVDWTKRQILSVLEYSMYGLDFMVEGHIQKAIYRLLKELETSHLFSSKSNSPTY